MENVTFLKTLRTKKRLTQQELANKLEMPIGTYQKWEQGLLLPSIIDLKKLKIFFGCSYTKLIESIILDYRK